MSDSEGGISWNVFIPMVLVIAALLGQAVFQNAQLRHERTALAAQEKQQDQPLEESKKLRAQLESLAGATATLADKGNENAARLRDYLSKQGITIKPPEAAPKAP